MFGPSVRSSVRPSVRHTFVKKIVRVSHEPRRGSPGHRRCPHEPRRGSPPRRGELSPEGA